MRLLLTLISAICLLQCLASDGFQSRRYSAADGLPSHTVRYIMQDSHGFIWIATLNGLTRFDGTRFVTFRSDPSNPLSLSDNRVHSITEDLNQYLWIETTSRIFSCFDLRKGRFVRYTDGDPRQYNRIFVAEDGDVWLSNTDGGALRVRHIPGRGLKSEIFDKASGLLPADGVNTVFETQDGTILIGTSAGFTRVKDTAIGLSEGREDIFCFFEVEAVTYAITASGKTFRINSTVMSPVGALPPGVKVTGVIPGPESVTVFSDQGIWLTDLRSGKTVLHPQLDIKGGEVLIDNKGRHWVYNHTGQLTFHSRKYNRYQTLHLIPTDIMGHTDHERYRIVEDNDDTIWISTYGNGLFAYREEDDSLRHFTAGEEGLIGSNSLRGMMLDDTGMLWLGAGQSGISTLWIDSHESHRFLPNPNEPTDRSNSIRMLYPGSEGKVFFSSKDGKLYDWMPGEFNARAVREFGSNIYSMLDDGKGTQLYGTRGDGLYVGDKHYKHIATDKTSLPEDNIYFIHRDRKGRVWIGTFGGGLALMNPDTENGAAFRKFFSDVHGRREQRHMIEDLDGRFWVGTSEGLLTFHPDTLMENATSGRATGPRHAFRVFSKATGDLNCNEVRFLMRDSKGELWIATGNDGVIRAATSSDGTLKVTRQYTAADGLSNNSIQSIVEDDGGSIWIATEYGLSRMDPDLETFENYIFSDVPQENVYAEGSVLKRKDGTLLFGTARGIVSIDPRKFSYIEGPGLSLRFTGLSINGVPYAPGQEESPLTETLDYSDRIVLKPHQNSFAVDFTVMDFRDSGRLRYSYMLEGHDKQWSAPSPEGTASFSYVPSGKYMLKVRCLDGGRIVAEGQLEILVKAPWWRAPWAIVGYIIIAGIVIWLIIRKKRASHGSDENVGTHGSCVREPSDTESDTNPSAADARAVQCGSNNSEMPISQGASPRLTDRHRAFPRLKPGVYHNNSSPSCIWAPAYLNRIARAVRPYQEDITNTEESAAAETSDPFLEKIERIAKANIANAQFSVDDFAAAMNLGRAVFYRKLKEVADTTPNEYLKKQRLTEAARLLREAPDLNIAEISDRVGFSDSLYLSKCFKAEFGQSPTNYRKSL